MNGIELKEERENSRSAFNRKQSKQTNQISQLHLMSMSMDGNLKEKIDIKRMSIENNLKDIKNQLNDSQEGSAAPKYPSIEGGMRMNLDRNDSNNGSSEEDSYHENSMHFSSYKSNSNINQNKPADHTETSGVARRSIRTSLMNRKFNFQNQGNTEASSAINPDRISELNEELLNQQRMVLIKKLFQRAQEQLQNKDDEGEEEKEDDSKGREVNAEMEKIHKDMMKKSVQIGNADVPEPYFLAVKEMNTFDRILINFDFYPDRFPFKAQRKKFAIFKKKMSVVCNKIIKNSVFEFISLLVIIFNCLTIVTEYSKDEQFLKYKPLTDKAERVFFAFYMLEFFLKVSSLGFIVTKHSYMRDGWNILDFVILLSSVMDLFYSQDTNLTGLKGLRVLRPLKTISKIKNLQIILISLFSSFPLLVDTFMILLFFYGIFAVAGLQLFSGLLKKKCMHKLTGKYIESLCGNLECPDNYICAKGISNPNQGLTNFDNIFYSFYQVFQIVTLDSWTSTMYMIQKVFTNFISVYFLVLVIIGGFFLVNLTLAVIKVKFTETHKIMRNMVIVANETKTFSLHLLVNRKLWEPRLEFKRFVFRTYRRRASRVGDGFGKLFTKFKPEDYEISPEAPLSPERRKTISNGMSRIDNRKSLYGSDLIKLEPVTLDKKEGGRKLSYKEKVDETKLSHKEKEVEPKLSFKEKAAEPREAKVQKTDVPGNDILETPQRSAKTKANGKDFFNFDTDDVKKDPTEEKVIKMTHENIIVESYDLKIEHDEDNNDSKLLLEPVGREEIRKSIFESNISQTIKKETTSEKNSANIPRESPPGKKLSPESLKSNQEYEVQLIKRTSNQIIIKEKPDLNRPGFSPGSDKPSPEKAFPKLKIGRSILLDVNEGTQHSSTNRDLLSAKKVITVKGDIPGNPIPRRSNVKKNSNKMRESVIDVDQKNLKKRKLHHESKLNDFKNSKSNVMRLQQAIQKTVNLTQVSKLWMDKPKYNSTFNLRKFGNNILKIGDFVNKNVVGGVANIKKIVNLPGMIFRRKEIDELDELDPRYLTIHVDLKLEYKSDSLYEVLDNLKILEEKKIQEKKEQEFKLIRQKKFEFVYKLRPVEGTFDIFKKLADLKINMLKIPSGFFNFEKPKNHVNFNSFLPLNRTSRIMHQDFFPSLTSDVKTEKSMVVKNNAASIDMSPRQKRSGVAARSGLISSQFLNASKKSNFMKEKSSIKQPVIPSSSSIMSVKNIGEGNSPGEEIQVKKKYHKPEMKYETMKEIINRKEEKSDTVFQDFQQDYEKILQRDEEKRKIQFKNWSGDDVMFIGSDTHANKMLNSLNIQNFDIWLKGLLGKWIMLRKYTKLMVQTKFFDSVFLLAVIINTTTMSLEGIIEDSLLDDFNMAFTVIFSFEFTAKAIGLGFKNYFRDKLNWIDLFMVLFSITEILISKANIAMDQNQLQSLRFIRCIKVFRLTRILRNLEFMKIIIAVVQRTYTSFVYIAFLLFLFIFVYALIGMTSFTGMAKDDSKYYLNNFDTFFVGFMSVFNMMTLNWTDMSGLGFRSDAGPLVTIVFCVSWIFIGNYVLLNLFLAILLDGFTNNPMIAEHQQEKEDDEQPELLNRDPSLAAKQTLGNDSKDGQKQKLEEIKENENENSDIGEDEMEKAGKNNDNDKKKEKDETIILNKRTENKRLDQKLADMILHHAQFSLFLFSKKSKVRIISYKIVKSTRFESITLFIIIITSVKLAVDTYLDENSTAYTYSKLIDALLNLFFFFEASVKIICQGFIWAKRAYLKDGWNQMDFFILVSGILDLLVQQVDLPFLRVIRLTRILRPLKFLNKNINMKLVVIALLESVGGILNVLLIVVIVWIIFSILGISLYRGMMGYCGIFTNFKVGDAACKNNSWKINEYNFENIYESLFTLLAIGTFDGWGDIMIVAVNSNNKEEGPIPLNNQFSSYFYFVSFILVINMFFLNLFIGVIFYNFTKAQKKNKHKFLTDSQVRWIQIQRLIVSAGPKFSQTKMPSNKIRQLAYHILNTKIFELIIMLTISGSVIAMALDYDDSPDDYVKTVLFLNQLFTFIFVGEAVLKVFAFGFQGYFYDPWNKFDFFIVFFSVIDVLTDSFFQDILALFSDGQKILRVIKVLRVGRLFRLVKKFEGVLKLVQTIIFSLPMILNIFSLLLLVYFIYSILGCFLFKNMVVSNQLDQYANFKNFAFAMMTLFKMSTGDEWSKILISLDDNNNYIGAIYGISFVLITMFILLNLFILIMLQQFEEYHINPNNPLQEFKNYVDKFRKKWAIFTAKQRGIKIHRRQIVDFFRTLEPPLGFGKDIKTKIIALELMKMNLKSDQDGFIFFNDLLYATIKRVYGDIILVEDENTKVIEELNKCEQETKMKLEIKKLKEQRLIPILTANKTRAASTKKGRESTKKIKDIYNINPLTDFLYRKLVYDAWTKFSQIILRRLRNVDLNPDERYYESQSEGENKNQSDSEDSSSSDSDSSSESPSAKHSEEYHENQHLNSLCTSLTDSMGSENDLNPEKQFLRNRTQMDALDFPKSKLNSNFQRKSMILPNSVSHFD